MLLEYELKMDSMFKRIKSSIDSELEEYQSVGMDKDL